MSASANSRKVAENTKDVSASDRETVLERGDDQETLASPEELGDMPQEFGRYRILRKLGEGGMGAVFLALDTEGDRRVALKTPSFARKKDEQIIKRFLREARVASKVDHPNVCPIFDSGEFDGQYYLTMAYIEGCELAEWVQLRDDIPTELALRIVQKIALGLQAVHDAGLVHRDLKPGNIMMTCDDEPIIMDFGMVRRLDTHETMLTFSGTMVGTPAYMAPEQILAEGDTIGPTTDLFSLGVILYELLTGWPPFSGSLVTILGTIVSHPTPELRTVCPHFDERLNELCLKALAKDQSERFQSGQEMADAIEAYLTGATMGPANGEKQTEQAEQADEEGKKRNKGLVQRIWSSVTR